MRITREKAAENREKVVAAAAGLFRRHGLAGVGIDTLAKAAGLTHGAVYSHFRSKNDVAIEAIRRALDESLRDWLALTEGRSGPDAFKPLLNAYVSRAHRDRPEAGCSLAAMSGDAARGGPELQSVFVEGVANLIGVLTRTSRDPDSAEGRQQAIARAAAMVGAIVLARAAAPDQALSDEILKAVRAELAAG